MKTCKNCGAVWDDSETFCKNCGAMLEDAPEEPNKTDNKQAAFSEKPPKRTGSSQVVPQNSKTKIIIFVIILAAAAVIAALALMSHRQQQYAQAVSRGDKYYNAGQYNKAIRAYSRATSLDSNADAPYEGRARCYLAQKKYGKALKALDSMKNQSDSAGTQVLYADIKTAQGDSKSAGKYYKKALKALPDEIAAEKDAQERENLIDLYPQIFSKIDATDSQMTKAAKVIREYGGDAMLMGTTNSNAVANQAVQDSFGYGSSVAMDGTRHFYLRSAGYDDVVTNDDGKTLYRSASGMLGNLNDYLGRLYFTEISDDGDGLVKVYRMRPDGSDAKKIITLSGSLWAEMIVYNNRIYLSYNHDANGAIASYDLDGGGKKTLAGTSSPFGIDGGHLFYLNGSSKLMKVKLSDGSASTLAKLPETSDDTAACFTVQNGQCYYAYQDDSAIHLTTIDTSSGKKTAVLTKKAAPETQNVASLFANDKQCYTMFWKMSGGSGLGTDEIVNEKGKTVTQAFDYPQRVSMTDDGFLVQDFDGALTLYQTNGKKETIQGGQKTDTSSQKRSKSSKATSSKSTTSSLDLKHIGVLLSLYWSPDWFKENVDDAYIAYDDTPNEDGYVCITSGMASGTLRYRCDGDTITYNNTPTATESITKTISLKRLINDYYNTSSKKTEVDDYVNRLKPVSEAIWNQTE